MITGPGQTAHERLAALARARRRDASGIGAMPATLRERLHREVLRKSEEGPGVPEPVPLPAVETWWRRWRSWVGLAAVGLSATAVVTLMIRSGYDSARRNSSAVLARDQALPESRRAGNSWVERKQGEVAPVGLDAPIAAGAAVPTSVSDAVPPGADRLESPQRKSVRTLDGMIRLRRGYVASAESNAPASAISILRRFDVVRAPGRVEFRDQDGSVYFGRVEGSRVAKEAGAADWVFEGRGTNVPLGQVVLITGHFGPGSGSQDRQPDEFMDLPFMGTAVIGGGQVVEIRAEPQP